MQVQMRGSEISSSLNSYRKNRKYLHVRLSFKCFQERGKEVKQSFTQTQKVVWAIMFTLVTQQSASPVEWFGEETGSSAEPAATGIFFSIGAGDGFVHVLLWDLVLLWEVAGDGRVVLHLHPRWIEWDKNLRKSILERRWLDLSLFYLHVDTKMVVFNNLIKFCTLRAPDLFSRLILHHLMGRQHLSCSDGWGKILQTLEHTTLDTSIWSPTILFQLSLPDFAAATLKCTKPWPSVDAVSCHLAFALLFCMIVTVVHK